MILRGILSRWSTQYFYTIFDVVDSVLLYGNRVHMMFIRLFVAYFVMFQVVAFADNSSFEKSRQAFEEEDYQLSAQLLEDELLSLKGEKLELALLMLGESRYVTGNMVGAAEVYRRLLETFPSSEYADHANHGLGWTLVQLGSPIEGANYLSRVNTGDIALESQIAAGRFYMRNQVFDQAAKVFITARTLDKEDEYGGYISYSLGEIEFARKNYVVAAGYFAEAAQKDKEFEVPALIAAGRSAMLGDDMAKALGFIQKAAELDPDHEEIPELLANLSGPDRDIAPLLERYERLDNPPVATTLALARLLISRDNPFEARRILDAPLPEVPEQRERWLYYRVISSNALGNVAEVVEHGQKYLSMYADSEDNRKIRSILANGLVIIGDHEKAVDVISSPAGAEGLSEKDRLNQAAIMISAGKPSEAGTLIAGINRNSPYRGDARFILAEIARKAGKLDDAITLYQEAIASSPTMYSDHARIRLARTYILHRNNYRAEILLQQVLNRDNSPVGPEALFTLGELHKLRGHYQQAIDAFMEYRKQRPAGALAAEALIQAGWCHYSLKQFDTALSLYGLAVSEGSRTERARAIYWIGNVYYERNDLKDAAAMYTRLEEEYGDFEDLDYAMFKLGRSYERLNNRNRAKSVFERLQQRFPGSRWADEARHRLRLY